MNGSYLSLELRSFYSQMFLVFITYYIFIFEGLYFYQELYFIKNYFFITY